jgi:hypothetical protein
MGVSLCLLSQSSDKVSDKYQILASPCMLVTVMTHVLAKLEGTEVDSQ